MKEEYKRLKKERRNRCKLRKGEGRRIVRKDRGDRSKKRKRRGIGDGTWKGKGKRINREREGKL